MKNEVKQLQKLAGLIKESVQEAKTMSGPKELEAILSNLSRNISTDSNIPTASKQGLLGAFNEMMDIVSDMLDAEEADSFYDDNMEEGDISEAQVPSNVKDFAKRKGITSLVNKVAAWAEKAGKKIRGGTAIGKNYDTLILDLSYQDGAIRIDIPEQTVTLYDEPVNNVKSFMAVLNSQGDNKDQN